jgi:hypothetical protein
MEITGAKTALDAAVAEARQRELQAGPAQLGLFEAGGAPTTDRGGAEGGENERPEGGQAVARRMGRPPGARNRRTDEAARIYMAEFGDPLRRGVAISALPILADGVLEGLARRLGCSRLEAARWWSAIYSATMPFIHTRLAALEIKPAGSPDADPVQWSFSDEGDLIDLAAPDEADQSGELAETG